MQGLCGSDGLNRRPLHRDFSGIFTLNHELFIVRLQDLPSDAITIGQNNLICEQRRCNRKDKDEECCYVEDAQLGHNSLLGKSISPGW